MSSQIAPSDTNRQQTMRHELISYMSRHHRRQRWSRSLLGLLFLIGTASVSYFILTTPDAHEFQSPQNSTAVVDTEDTSLSQTTYSIQFVKTGSASLDHYRSTPPATIRWLDDEALLDTLAAIDRPTGLIKRGGTIKLISLTNSDQLQEDESSPGSQSRKHRPDPGNSL